jgi:hypothetical protein
VWETPQVIRRIVLLASISLLGASCSDSLDTTTATTAPPAAVASTEAPPTTEATPAAASATTEAEAAPTTTTDAQPAPLVPIALCYDSTSFGVTFAYDNQSSSVVIVDGDDNVVTGSNPDDQPFVPTVFAPGLVSPAFHVYPPEGEAVSGAEEPAPLTWTLVGPDGQERTASGDADLPECTDELLEPTTADPREPAIEVTSAVLDAAGETVEIEATVVGVPDLSVCNAAFEPQPVIIRMDEGTGETVVDGDTSTWTAEVFDLDTIGPAARFVVAAIVIDQCSYDGTTFSAWPTGEFEPLLEGVIVCARVVDGALEVDILETGCTDLGFTGGVRIRTG